MFGLTARAYSRELTSYQKGGKKGLAVYRDKKRPEYVAEEFAAMIDEMPSLQRRDPAMRQYLLEYPKTQLPNSTSFFYWHKVNFGLKPTIMINHVVITETPEHTLVASKQIYASHYFFLGGAGTTRTHSRSVSRRRILVRRRQQGTFGQSGRYQGSRRSRASRKGKLEGTKRRHASREVVARTEDSVTRPANSTISSLLLTRFRELATFLSQPSGTIVHPVKPPLCLHGFRGCL